MKLEVDVHRMARTETAEAARLHDRELPHEFLTRFGPGFLSCYYRAFVESPHAVALAANVDGLESSGLSGRRRLGGVLIGTFDTGAHYSYLVRRHGLRLALSTLRQSVRSPRLAIELLRTRLVRYLRGILRSLGYTARTEKKGAAERDGERVGFLAYVAVDNGLRGQGVGRRLFEAYEELAREAGLRRLELVTLPDERGAAPFFESAGWKRKGEITSRSGELYAFFTKTLDD